MEWMDEIPIEETGESVWGEEAGLREAGLVTKLVGEGTGFCTPLQPALAKALSIVMDKDT